MEFKKYDKVYVKANSTSYDGKYKGAVGTINYIRYTDPDHRIAVLLQSFCNPESKYGWFYFYPNELSHTMAAKNEAKAETKPFSIKDVIFNDPAVIVLWTDGSKTVVKCGENDIFDPEKGLAMAISKKALGNQGNYYETFKKYLPEEGDDVFDWPTFPSFDILNGPSDLINNSINVTAAQLNAWAEDVRASVPPIRFNELRLCASCKHLCQPLGSSVCFGCTVLKENWEPTDTKGESK